MAPLAAVPPLRVFDVTYLAPDEESGMDVVADAIVNASYFVTEGSMIVFKGQAHELLFGVNADRFLSATRREPSTIVNMVADLTAKILGSREVKETAD